MINNFYGDIAQLSTSKLTLETDTPKLGQQLNLIKDSKEDLQKVEIRSIFDDEINGSGFEIGEDFSNHIDNQKNNKKILGEDLIIDNSDAGSSDVMLPKVLPLIKEQYSLEPDMLFGWVPKITHGAPIPLIFEDQYLDNLLINIRDKYVSNQIDYSKYEIIYHGFRPRDTFQLHAIYSGEQSYPFKFGNLLFSKYQNIAKYWKKDEKDSIRQFMGMNPKWSIAKKKEILTKDRINPTSEGSRKIGFDDDINQESKSCDENVHTNGAINSLDSGRIENNVLTFDSHFESGNLDTVLKIGDNEYDLFMRVDSNTKGHTSWYYFKVTGMKANQRVKFNIINFSKPESLYKRGKRPYVYSEMQCRYLSKGWHQSGENLTYKLSQFGSSDNCSSSQLRRKKYWKLSFEYNFIFEDDAVYFALCIPYTYSDLLKFIKTLFYNNENNNDGIIKQSKLCMSLGGVDVPLLNITDYNNSEIPYDERDVIICTGRVHPGESNGSWMIHGFLEWICSNCEEAKYMRKKFIFRIIPMLNPDGVILGNHRTGVCGNDLNRQYLDPDERLHPTIFALKQLFSETKKNTGGKIFAYIDFHGHSLKKNVFMYGSEFPLHNNNYYRVRILPKLISQNTKMFRYSACIFRINKAKVSTARAVFSQQYGIANCYTLEASYASYMNDNRETSEFNAGLFIEMGSIIGKSLHQYKLLIEEEKIKKNKKLKSKMFSKQFHQDKGVIDKNTTLVLNTSADTHTSTLHLTSSLNDPRSSPENKSKKEIFLSRSNTDIKSTTSLNNTIPDTPSQTGSNNAKMQVKNLLNQRYIVSPESNKECEKTTKLDFYTGNYSDLDLSLPKRPHSSTQKDYNNLLNPTKKEQLEIIEEVYASKLKKNKSKQKKRIKIKKDKSKKEKNQNLEDDTDQIQSDDDLGINILLREIKTEAKKSKKETEAESNSLSEGRSDSESSGDDFGEEDMKNLHKEIIKKVEEFSDYIKSNIIPDPKSKKKTKPPIAKKKSELKSLERKKSEATGKTSASNIKPFNQALENAPPKSSNNLFRIKSIRANISPDKDRGSQINKTSDGVAPNYSSEYLYNDADGYSHQQSRTKTTKFESELAVIKAKKKSLDNHKLFQMADPTSVYERKNAAKISLANFTKPEKDYPVEFATTLNVEFFGCIKPKKICEKSRPATNGNTKPSHAKYNSKNDDNLPPNLDKLYNRLHRYFGSKSQLPKVKSIDSEITNQNAASKKFLFNNNIKNDNTDGNTNGNRNGNIINPSLNNVNSKGTIAYTPRDEQLNEPVFDLEQFNFNPTDELKKINSKYGIMSPVTYCLSAKHKNALSLEIAKKPNDNKKKAEDFPKDILKDKLSPSVAIHLRKKSAGEEIQFQLRRKFDLS